MDDAVKNISEAIDELRDKLSTIDETNWGPWKLDRKNRKVYMEKPHVYALPIVDLSTNSLVTTLKLMEEKTWVDNECLGGLARAACAMWSALGDPLLTK